MNEDILKTVQTIQIQLADILLSFCKKNNLTIWAGYGTLLGAVRHKGFIPWDDDMDFVMLRKDYDQLKLLASKSTLPFPFVFDCSRVDVIKLRNCNTTQIATFKINNKENFGIWIDIWCLDSFNSEGVPDIYYNKIRRNLRLVTNASQMSYLSSNNCRLIMSHTFSLAYVGFWGHRIIYNRIEKLIKALGNDNSEMLVNILLYSRLKKNISYKCLKQYEKKWFSKTVYLEFEGRQIPCPVCYHDVLKAEYGDYMTPVKGSSVHETTILDVSRPYKQFVKEYMDNLPWYKRILKMI